MILTLSLPIADPKALPNLDVKPGVELFAATACTRRLAPSVAEAEAEATLVLLVDDHPVNRFLLESQLQALGYAAESAEDGVEALEKWQSGRFAIVITDCNMPKMDGYELTRRIREREASGDDGIAHKRTPIIACTANALGGQAETCFAAGMDDYLVKPVELSQMLKKLNRWLPIPVTSVMPPTAMANTPDAAIEVPPVDDSTMAAIWGDDPETRRNTLKDFQRVNEEDATMLLQAVAANDSAQVAYAAHRMLGASRMVGATDFGSICEHIEQASRADDWKSIKTDIEVFEAQLQRLNRYISTI